jgi:hypothetical protein
MAIVDFADGGIRTTIYEIRTKNDKRRNGVLNSGRKKVEFILRPCGGLRNKEI